MSSSHSIRKERLQRNGGVCLCGNKAFKVSMGGLVCERCDRIEKNLHQNEAVTKNPGRRERKR